MMRARQFVIVVGLMLMTACGGTKPVVPQPAPQTPAQVAANDTYQVLARINDAQVTAKSLYDAHVAGFSDAAAKQIAMTGYEINKNAKKLAGLLEAYDQLTDPAAKLAAQQAITDTLKLVHDGVAAFGGVDTGTTVAPQILKAYTDAVALVEQVKALWAQIKGGATLLILESDFSIRDHPHALATRIVPVG